MLHSTRGLVEAREVEAVLLLSFPGPIFVEFIRAEGTGLLLDMMPRVSKTEAMGLRGLGTWREGSVPLDFELDWVVSEWLSPEGGREVERERGNERVRRRGDKAGERKREGESKERERNGEKSEDR